LRAAQTAGKGHRYASLLVTAHRPSPRLDRGLADACALLAPAGEAVAVGHPWLEPALQARLPAGWRCVWLPELVAEMLRSAPC
jgi:hypothetical protein